MTDKFTVYPHMKQEENCSFLLEAQVSSVQQQDSDSQLKLKRNCRTSAQKPNGISRPSETWPFSSCSPHLAVMQPSHSLLTRRVYDEATDLQTVPSVTEIVLCKQCYMLQPEDMSIYLYIKKKLLRRFINRNKASNSQRYFWNFSLCYLFR